MSDAMFEVAQRFRTFFIDSRPSQIGELAEKVAGRLAAQRLDPGYGGWGDPAEEYEKLSWDGSPLSALVDLAVAWATPGSPYYHDAEVARRLELGWAFFHRAIYPDCPFPNNWWAWQIGIPEALNVTLLAAGEALSAESRQSMLASVRHLVDHVWDFHPGANAMWAAMVFLGYGLAAEDPAYLELAAATVDRAGELTNTQGILPDYSYSFHGRGLNMGYGSLHFNYIGRFTYLMGDSPWRMCDRTLGNAVNMLLEFVQWTIVGDGIDPFILDRGISVNDDASRATAIIDGALLLSAGPIPQREDVRACCRRLIDQGLPPENPVAAAIAAELPDASLPPLYGMRYWPEGEYFVARQPGWTASVKMASEKNKCYFGINGTNLKGWHISDGHLIFRFHGDEYRRGTMPTMDWERLTGITRADGFKLPEETHGQSWFAGGAANAEGTLGCCGIDFTLHNLDRTALNARKSWFFLGEAIVALATGITCTGDEAVETIIRHAQLPDAVVEERDEELQTEILAGHDCAYILPGAPRIIVRTEVRSGRWSDLRMGAPESPLLTRAYWTALLPHGMKPENDRYIIVYLPGFTTEQAAAWWAEQPFEILQQDNLAHRVRDRRTGAILTVRQWVGAGVE
ncbi:MAG: polysaccharide lyase family 8 super-sandwich domain-containing protein [Armatimonadota bacterium]